ncbi:spermidine/putrescine transport system permease protein [Nitrosospira sp. Nl5]|uniref:ABC transporter permease n=1 Tax=Nitrosospira sp. Nl5 TaxID=200120 RepID=UPI00088D3D96|nr:ABC transporter permease [Nitrosospira sp. Nl5]SCY72095.1 spermidine/putrescine transport system permease protein [Nitrosospira sp. Nl5]
MIKGSVKQDARENRAAKFLVSGPPLLFLVVFFVAPSLIMVLTSFRFPGEFGGLAPIAAPAGASPGEYGLTAEAYQFFFGDILYARIFLKSFGVAATTTLICLIMAYPLALLIARSKKSFRNLMVLLVVLPFASNFLIRIYAWMIILGPESGLSYFINTVLGAFGIGPVALLFSPFAVLVGMVYVHLPFMVLPLYTNLEKHDSSLLDAAQDLGATRWQRFWRVTWPLSLPGVFSGSALVFIPVLGMFAVPDILGGTGDILIGNLIKDQFLGTRDWPFGSALSIMLTLAVLSIAGMATWFARSTIRQRAES